MNEIVDLVLTRIDSVGSPANEYAEVKLTKAETLPNPDLSAQPYQPVEPPPIAIVNLDAIAEQLKVLVASGRLASSDRKTRESAHVEFESIRNLLAVGSARQAMAEQATAQRRNGVGVDNGTTTWDGTSIRTNADGSKQKVTSTVKADLGAMIVKARVEKRLTQVALAEAADVSVRTVKSWEAGEAAPSPLLSHRLAVALALDTDQREAFAALLRAARR